MKNKTKRRNGSALRTPHSALDKIHEETGVTMREVLTECARRQAVVEANADPLPGPLALAFPARPITVGAFSVRAPRHADWATLRHLDSPLLKQMAELRKPKAEREPTPYSDQEEWEMILVLLLDPERAAQEVARDRRAFGEFAAQQSGNGRNPVVVELLKNAAVKQFSDMFITALEFSATAPANPEGGNADFFSKPPLAPKTASAGGSPSSAV